MLYRCLSAFMLHVSYRNKECDLKLPPGGSWIREWMEHPRAKTEGECAIGQTA